MSANDRSACRPIRLTDPAKVTAWAVEWLPWGGVHTISGSETLNARFPGQWFQVESGLHYNWHRHYDPTIGRYTQPDPLGFVDGPSVYAYARNAPGAAVDLEGEQARGPTRGGRQTPPGNPRQIPSPGATPPPQTVPPLPGGGRQCTDGNPHGKLGGPELRNGPPASTPTGRRGDHLNVPPGTNAPATIGGREYSGHAIDRMQSQGITPSAVQGAIATGTATPGNTPGATRYDAGNIVVITNSSGSVVTVFHK